MHLLKKVKKYGEISFSINGNEISTINIVAKNSVDKIKRDLDYDIDGMVIKLNNLKIEQNLASL